MAWRYLKENKGNSGPSACYFLDSETVPITEREGDRRTWHVLQCWCASGGRMSDGRLAGRAEAEGVDADEFWEWLADQLEPRRVTWLWAHNWGFDCESMGFRQRLESGEYLLSAPGETVCGDDGKPARKRAFNGLWVDEGPPAITSLLHASGARLVILDTMNWLPTSLGKIGAQLGMQKTELPEPGDPLETWFERCRQDVRILERTVLALCNWVRTNDLGNMRYTAAGQALAHFRHRKHAQRIVLHDVEPVKKLERQSYYGGRVEIYYKGPIGAAPLKTASGPDAAANAMHSAPVGPLYELDASALYPSVMAAGFFPRVLRDWWQWSADSQPAKVRLSDACIADVWLHSPNRPWPIRTDRGVIWATGSFRTVLAGPELGAALQLGSVQRCYGFARYELARLFKPWAQEVWQRRMAAEASGRPLEARLWKYLANSLHGKFGQRTSLWELMPGQIHDQPWDVWTVNRCASVGEPGDGRIPRDAQWDESQQGWRWTEKRRSIGGQVFRAAARVDCDHTFCAISAWVASAARERVRDWMEIAGPGNVLAVHTDSLICTAEGYTNLQNAGQIREREMGYLRLVNCGVDGTIESCGRYRVGEKQCLAGISLNHVRLADGSYQWQSFRALSSASFGPPGPGVLVTTRHCQPTQEYRKGVVTPDGWIAPHTFRTAVPDDGAAVEWHP